MILFINPIGENIRIFLVEGVEVRHTSTIPKGKDYDLFPETIIDLIDRHDIDNIWCIVGPGAFTRMRIVTLTLNTISLTKKIGLKTCHFFEIIPENSPILVANNHEYIILSDEKKPIFIEKAELSQEKTYMGYADKNDFTEEKNYIEYREDFREIRRIFETQKTQKSISPIYLKEPHITWSKKNTFPSSKTMNK